MAHHFPRFECSGGSLQLREPDDWHMLDHVTCWQHAPTTAVFELSVNPLMFVDAPLRTECLQAKLVHLCDGQAVPPETELRRLAQEAVLMCLHELGVVTFVSDHWLGSESGRIS